MPEAQATPSSYFTLELGGGEKVGAFREIKGLQHETDVIDAYSVDEQGRPRLEKVSGRTKTSDITFTRYSDDNCALFKLAQKVADEGAAAAKRDMTIRHVDYHGKTVSTYSLVGAWPRKYVAASLSADQNSVAVEEVVLAHEGFKKI